MRYFLPALATVFCFASVACVPVEPEYSGINNRSIESVDQWQRDPHDTRTVLDRTELLNLSQKYASATASGRLLAEFVINEDPADTTFLYLNPVRASFLRSSPETV